MSPFVPATPLAETRRAMPGTLSERSDAAAAAVISLATEQRRLEQLGLEWPLARTAHQLRYWRFVHSMCVIAEEAA